MAPKAPWVRAISSGSKPRPELARQGCRDHGARLGLVGLVGEPVLVLRLDAPAERGDQPGQRHLVRVAEGEVAGLWPVFRPLAERLEERPDGREFGGGGPAPLREAVHGSCPLPAGRG